MKKITYCGHFVNKNMLGRFRGPAVSANRMQIGLLEELSEYYPDINLISVLPIATYPVESSKVISDTVNLSDRCGIKYKQMPFFNVFILKQFTIRHSLRNELKKSAKESDVVINFNPYYELEKETLSYCKKNNKKAVCIIADIPVTIPQNYSFIKKLLRKYEIKEYYAAIRKYDAVIVLNKEVIKEFEIDKPFYLMDGGVSESEIEESSCCPLEKRKMNRILYTGAIEDYNGILELVEGFMQTQTDNLELVICGDGSLRDEVQKQISKSDNIKYLGYVCNEEAKKLQAESGLLINPRPIDRFALKLTFPSKIIEYMLSGTPVLTTRLNGLADSYDEYLFYCGQSPEEIAKGIDDYFKMDVETRLEKASKARNYVICEKNYRVHAKGIVELLEKIR